MFLIPQEGGEGKSGEEKQEGEKSTEGQEEKTEEKTGEGRLSLAKGNSQLRL